MNKTLLLFLLLFAALSAAIAGQDSVIIFRKHILGPDARKKLNASVSIPRAELDALPKVNLFEEEIPLALSDAVDIATKAFRRAEPRLARSIVLGAALQNALSPSQRSANLFIGVPMYVLDIYAFLDGEEEPTSYSKTFVVLPDRTARTLVYEEIPENR